METNEDFPVNSTDNLNVLKLCQVSSLPEEGSLLEAPPTTTPPPGSAATRRQRQDGLGPLHPASLASSYKGILFI